MHRNSSIKKKENITKLTFSFFDDITAPVLFCRMCTGFIVFALLLLLFPLLRLPHVNVLTTILISNKMNEGDWWIKYWPWQRYEKVWTYTSQASTCSPFLFFFFFSSFFVFLSSIYYFRVFFSLPFFSPSSLLFSLLNKSHLFFRFDFVVLFSTITMLMTPTTASTMRILSIKFTNVYFALTLAITLSVYIHTCIHMCIRGKKEASTRLFVCSFSFYIVCASTDRRSNITSFSLFFWVYSEESNEMNSRHTHIHTRCT